MKLTRFSMYCFVMLAFAAAACARGEDVFYSVKVADLSITDGQWPEKFKNAGEYDYMQMEPRLSLDGAGEIYLRYKDDDGGAGPTRTWFKHGNFKASKIVVRVPERKDVTGRLLVPKDDKKELVALRFSISKDAATSEKDFFEAKAAHLQRLIDTNLPGTAWFRHQREEIDMKYRPADTGGRLRRNPERGTFEQETFELFTGGRAISENLQLDREMLVPAGGAEMVAADSLPGITVQEMDWKALIKDAKPQLDPLAAAIPADQHALFFPSFSAMLELTDEADANGTPVLQLLEPRAEDARTGEKLHTQLCLEASTFSRLLGPTLISSVVFTGSDPYLRTGSDVAVLFEAKSVTTLAGFVTTKHTAALAANQGAQAVKGDIAGVAYSGVVSPNREICSYTASSGDVVIVTNSLHQLDRVLTTIKGTTASMQSLPEYTFFRTRYTRGEKDETGLLILTDAAIRRWCGPRWRIGNARRTYAAAALSELQARHADALAKGVTKDVVVESEFKGLGEVTLTSKGVRSAIYNTLDFQTPIVELDLAKVSSTEAAAYKTWRDGYQQNWRQYFDPIAVRTGVTAARLTADVTVMPLIAGTEYREIIELAKGAKIDAHAADRHKEEILNVNVALNPEFKELDFLWDKEETKLKHWMGQTVTIFQDDDPIWKELLKAAVEPEKVWKERGARFPVVVSVAVRNEEVAKKFLLQALEKTKEDNTPPRWEEKEHNGRKYFQVRLPDLLPGLDPNTGGVAIYCAVLPDVMLVSLDEDVFKRTLDRHAARKAKAEEKPAAEVSPMLGEQLGLHVKKTLLQVIERSMRETRAEQMQELSWGNLPILNEWKRLYPQSDPLAIHEKLWGVKLVCPAGGKYAWNEKYSTMESTALGHPAEPKTPGADTLPPALARVRSGNFGLTFENQGLRAKVVIERDGK